MKLFGEAVKSCQEALTMFPGESSFEKLMKEIIKDQQISNSEDLKVEEVRKLFASFTETPEQDTMIKLL